MPVQDITVRRDGGIVISSIPDEATRDVAQLSDNGDGILYSYEDPTLYQRLREGDAPAPDPVLPGGTFPGDADQLFGRLDESMRNTTKAISTGAHVAGTVGASLAGPMVKTGSIVARAVRNGAQRLADGGRAAAQSGGSSAVTAAATSGAKAVLRTAVSSSVVGAMIGAGVSLTENAIAVVSGSRTMAEAKKDFGKDLAVGAIVGAASGAAVALGAPVIAVVAVGVGVGWLGRKLVNAIFN